MFQVEVNLNAGIFVTMNPAGKGYGGRQKLPDNLKQLFRPVAMTVPDNVVITQVLLYAEGFRFSNVLSTKLAAVFTLAKEFLSEQQHYDWGLRSLKSVIQACGTQLRQANLAQGSYLGCSEFLEKIPQLAYTPRPIYPLALRFVFLYSHDIRSWGTRGIEGHHQSAEA